MKSAGLISRTDVDIIRCVEQVLVEHRRFLQLTKSARNVHPQISPQMCYGHQILNRNGKAVQRGRGNGERRIN